MKKLNAKKAVRLINADEVRAALDRQSRDPFRDLLAEVLGSRPTPEAISALAERNPDRYGQLLAIVGRLAGYTERTEVETSVTVKVHEMSDAELEMRLAELERAQARPVVAAAVEPATPKRPRQRKPRLVLLPESKIQGA